MFGALKNIGASFSGVGTSLVPVAQSTAMKTGEDAMMEEGGEQELSPMEQFVEVLQGMYDSLLTMRDDIAYIAGAQILEERGSGRDSAIEDEDRGEKGEGEKEEDGGGSGIFNALKNVFSGLDMGFGDKMKMLLFGSLLLGITKYADKIIPPLTKTLEFLKDTLFPALEGIFDVVDDETGEIKWTKILGMGLGAYVLMKMGPLLLTLATKMLFTAGGMKVAGIVGLAIWATTSIFQVMGDWAAAKDWTEDMGATDNETLNKISGALAGDLEGGIMNAFKNASKWAGIGVMLGLPFGPPGMIVGGIIGGAIGGLLGWIGGGKIARTLEGIGEGLTNMWNKVTQSISDIFYDREIADGPGGLVRTQRSKVGQIYDKAAALGESLGQWVSDTWNYLTGWIPSTDDFMEMGYNAGQFIKNIVDDIKKFVWDGSKPQIMGIDLGGIADALPSIDEIKQNIWDMLPDFMKPKTDEQKQQVKDLSDAEESGLFDKDYVGKSEIDKDMVKKAPPSQLKAILALESDDLREEDILFIKAELLKKEGTSPITTRSQRQPGFEMANVQTVNKIKEANEDYENTKTASGTVDNMINNVIDSSVKSKVDNTYVGAGNQAYGNDLNAWASFSHGNGASNWGIKVN